VDGKKRPWDLRKGVTPLDPRKVKGGVSRPPGGRSRSEGCLDEGKSWWVKVEPPGKRKHLVLGRGTRKRPQKGGGKRGNQSELCPR